MTALLLPLGIACELTIDLRRSHHLPWQDHPTMKMTHRTDETGNQSVYNVTVRMPLPAFIGTKYKPAINARDIIYLLYPARNKRTIITESKFYLNNRKAKVSALVSVLSLALSLFVSRILTDYSDTTLSLDDLTFFANRFY